jgi:hypothetical protein
MSRRDDDEPRELVTIGDASSLGAFEWSDLLNPHNLIVDAEEQFPWLYQHWHPNEAPPAPPPFPSWAVGAVGASVAVLLVTWFVTRKPKSNPRRRRRKK